MDASFTRIRRCPRAAWGVLVGAGGSLSIVRQYNLPSAHLRYFLPSSDTSTQHMAVPACSQTLESQARALCTRSPGCMLETPGFEGIKRKVASTGCYGCNNDDDHDEDDETTPSTTTTRRIERCECYCHCHPTTTLLRLLFLQLLLLLLRLLMILMMLLLLLPRLRRLLLLDYDDDDYYDNDYYDGGNQTENDALQSWGLYSSCTIKHT